MATRKASTSGHGPRSSRSRLHEILDVSAELFHRKGYGATSLRDIGDAVGIGKGSLYHYVDSKEDLLYRIVQDAHAEALHHLSRVVRLEGGALQKIRALVVAHFAYNAEHLVKMGVFLREFRSLSGQRRRVILENRDRYAAFLRDLIRQAQTEGSVRPEVDATLATLAILGMLNTIDQWYSHDRGGAASDTAELYADFVVAGLACAADPHTPGHRRAHAPLQTAPPS